MIDMKRFIVLFVCVAMGGMAFAQTNFQKLSFREALEKAKAEGKMVFVDCYTTWCGPCKMMAEEVLPLPEVGEYLNARFVCLQIDMERGEGPDLAKEYAVDAYPTFLLVNADGTLKNRHVGAVPSGADFVARVKMLAGESPTARMDSLYAGGLRMTSFLLSYLQVLDAAGNTEQAQRVVAELMPTLNDALKTYQAYWFIYESSTLTPAGSENEAYLLSHVDAFRKGVGEAAVNRRVYGILENRLEDIVRGRNRAATLEDVRSIERTLDSVALPDAQYLADLAALAEGMKALDADKTFAAVTKLFPTLDEKKLAYLYFQPLVALRGKWSAEQREALTTLTTELSERVTDTALKDSLKRFAESVLPEL